MAVPRRSDDFSCEADDGDENGSAVSAFAASVSVVGNRLFIFNASPTCMALHSFSVFSRSARIRCCVLFHTSLSVLIEKGEGRPSPKIWRLDLCASVFRDHDDFSAVSLQESNDWYCCSYFDCSGVLDFGVNRFKATESSSFGLNNSQNG